MSLTLYTHTDCLDHDPGTGHPENPQRLRGILDALAAGTDLDLTIKQAQPGNDEQILLAHSAEHVAHVRNSAPDTDTISLDPDTWMSPGSLNAALLAVGAACQGVDDLMTGQAQTVFCATRPPGHHATPTHAMGFCLFNQVAIAALYAQQQYHLERIAIVDFDVHHGNGTQDIMQGREGMFYISTHQSPFYPGSGLEEENRSFNILNLPLDSGTGHEVYVERFRTEILPALEAFNPQLLLVSAGFDAHRDDHLASLALTNDTYRWLGMRLKHLANTCCEGRLLSTLEGGYNLGVLPGSVMAYLDGNLEAADR